MKQLILALSVLSLCACESGNNQASGGPAVVGSGKVFIYGDDISTGQGVTNPYWKIIAARTGKTVVNRSYSNALGSNSLVAGQGPSIMSAVFNFSYNTLARMKSEITPSDVIVIFVGYNDARWAGNTATLSQQYNDNFVPFLSQAYQTGAQIYVITPIKMKTSSYSIATVQNTVTLNQGSDAAMLAIKNLEIATVAGYGSSGVKLLDLQSTFTPADSNLQSDLQLPNDLGHQQIAEQLLSLGGI